MEFNGRMGSTKQQQPDLATIRTELANERTVLAYGRTALMLVATGVSLVKFLKPSFDFLVIGWVLIACGGLVALVGIRRFTRLRRQLLSRYSGTDVA